MRRQRLDSLGVTQTHSHRQGWQFAPLYTALDSGAVDVEGKVVLVLKEVDVTLRQRTLSLCWRCVDRLQLVLVYAGPPVVHARRPNLDLA